MTTGKKPQLIDCVLGILIAFSIISLVLTFFGYLPSIANQARDMDRAKEMALRGCIATAISTSVLIISFISIRRRLKRHVCVCK
jgi:amino acid permease